MHMTNSIDKSSSPLKDDGHEHKPSVNRLLLAEEVDSRSPDISWVGDAPEEAHSPTVQGACFRALHQILLDMQGGRKLVGE